MPHPDVQLDALQVYAVLNALRPNWSGALILNVQLDAAGTALSYASNVAGAVCLTVEADPGRARAGLRTGACDFVVNTLDEALRAIKNEIRQQRPLSVVLQAETAGVLDEIVARGVAPQLFAAPNAYPAHRERLAAFGARLLELRGQSPHHSPADLGESPALRAAVIGEACRSTAQSPGMSVETRRFTSAAELRAFDARALALLPDRDEPRRRWLTHAARLFPRDRSRSLWLTAEESALLAETVISPGPGS